MAAGIADRLRARASAILICLLALAAPARGQAVASGCTDISSVPPIYSGIQYGAAIQGLFNNFGVAACTDCHEPPTPPQDLDLSAGISWGELVNHLSSQDINLFRVVPNHPEQSLLFKKINCDTPAVGARMPYGYPSDTLTAEQQALIYDWIAEGAPVGTTDGVFRNGFDIRGLVE
jgi:hypothetical protein